METQKKAWGGAREGAGRPCGGGEKRITVCYRVSPETARKIEEYAEMHGLSKGKMVDLLAGAYSNVMADSDKR